MINRASSLRGNEPGGAAVGGIQASFASDSLAAGVRPLQTYG